MKRLVKLLLVLAMAFCMLSFAVSAEDADILDSGTCGDNLTWTMNKSWELTVSGTGDMYDYDLENNQAPWQMWMDQIKTITIEDGVTGIGDYAFYESYYLYEVNLGSVQTIGDYAFAIPHNYQTFPEITIPASVTSVGSGAFAFQNAYAFRFEGSIPSFGEAPFQECEAAIVCPYGDNSWTKEGLEAIGGELTLVPCGGNGFEFKGFGGNTGTGNIYWCYNATSDTLWITGSGDMYNYTYRAKAPWIEEGYDEIVQEVIIDEGITSIGDWSFSLCYDLMEVSIPDSVTYIGEYAFRCCGMEYIEIPANVSYIGADAFIRCENLATVVFEGSAPNMHYESFYSTITNAWYPAGDASWDGWTNVSFGGYMKWFPYTADTRPEPGLAQKPDFDMADIQWTFDSSTATLTVYGVGPMFNHFMFEWDNYPWKQHKEDAVHLVIGDGIESISSAAFSSFQNLETVKIADSVKVINAYAFENCFNLNAVTLSGNLMIIDEGVFKMCQNLPKIHIPDSVFYIGANAFFSNSALTEIHLPESLRQLKEHALSATGLTTLTIPANVTYLDSFVLWNSTITSLYFSGNAPAFHSDAFNGTQMAAYYPSNNATWTSDVMNRYGGRVTWVPYDAGPAEIPGDMSGDGIVDNLDVALLLWYTLFPDSYEIIGNADFNADGSVNDADVAYLLWHTLFPDSYPL